MGLVLDEIYSILSTSKEKNSLKTTRVKHAKTL